MSALNGLTHAETQLLIGKLLTHQAPARFSFMEWWQELNAELSGHGHRDAGFGEARDAYESFVALRTTAAAHRIMSDRAPGGAA